MLQEENAVERKRNDATRHVKGLLVNQKILNVFKKWPEEINLFVMSLLVILCVK